jgi:hypothetical protein
MLLNCAGNGWLAELTVSDEISPDGLVHCQVRVRGDSQEQALKATQYLFQMFTGGRESYIRAYPEALSDLDFDTKQTLHQGYARFSVQTLPDRQTDLTVITGQMFFKGLGKTLTAPQSLPSRDTTFSTDGTNG